MDMYIYIYMTMAHITSASLPKKLRLSAFHRRPGQSAAARPSSSTSLPISDYSAVIYIHI